MNSATVSTLCFTPVYEQVDFAVILAELVNAKALHAETSPEIRNVEKKILKNYFGSLLSPSLSKQLSAKYNSAHVYP